MRRHEYRTVDRLNWQNGGPSFPGLIKQMNNTVEFTYVSYQVVIPENETIWWTLRGCLIYKFYYTIPSYSIPLDWKATSRCFPLHYADKRDITTLKCQMSILVQGHQSVEDFYQGVYKNLSLILNNTYNTKGSKAFKNKKYNSAFWGMK